MEVILELVLEESSLRLALAETEERVVVDLIASALSAGRLVLNHGLQSKAPSLFLIHNLN